MRLSQLLTPFGLVAVAFGALADRQPEEAESLITELNEQAFEALRALEEGSSEKRADGTCNLFTATIRKDWAALSKKERTAYIDAVKCLQSKPSKSDPNWAPGARTRYDDFVAIHIYLTTSIHSTGNFLTWHRYFVHTYEQALKNECAYKGAQPYWNWFAHQDDINKSPVYDGSETSMGGTGSFVQHEGAWAATGQVLFAPGKGGGCVQSGPFTGLTVNLGPVRPGMRSLPPSPNGNLGYNPHCLRRDISNDPMRYMTTNNLLNITVGQASHSIKLFQDELQGRFGDKFVGMHSAGHYVAGGDATDVFASPVDPSFFLHHAMVDRVYWIWQVLHPKEANTVAGTITIGNNPPSRDALPSDLLDLGVLAKKIKLSDAFNTLAGPFCYIYL